MQKKFSLFLWLVSTGTIVGMEATPDASPAVIHRYEKAPPAPTPKQFLARATSLKTGVGSRAAKLVRGARKKARTTLKPKDPSPPKEASIPTQPPCSSGMYYANIPRVEESSPYQKLHDLASATSPYGQWIFPSDDHGPPVFTFSEKYNNVIETMQSMAAQQGPASPPNISEPYEQLRTALYNGDQETAAKLIMSGSDPDTQDSFSGNTILHIAALQGRYDCVGRLFINDYRPNPNVKNNKGQTVLHILASSKDPIATRATISFLRQDASRTPANIYATDASGKTPLECAAQAKNRRMVRILLKHTEPGHQSIGLARAKAHNHKKIVALFAKYPDASKLSKSSSDDDDEVIYAPLGTFKIF